MCQLADICVYLCISPAFCEYVFVFFFVLGLAFLLFSPYFSVCVFYRYIHVCMFMFVFVFLFCVSLCVPVDVCVCVCVYLFVAFLCAFVSIIFIS